MKSETLKSISLFIISVAFVAFLYGVTKGIAIANKRQIGTSSGIYTNYVTTSPYISNLAYKLTKDCTSKLCKAQALLDYTTAIPYKTKLFQQSKPKKTIEQNFGDCDDKSNLLISMLHAQNIEAYFVLVPKHIFIIARLDDHTLLDIKGLWIDRQKYYILEGTAQNSKVGFALKRPVSDIETIFDPFSNESLDITNIRYQ